MSRANEHDHIGSVLERLAEEEGTVEDVEDWDDQFYVKINGGKNEAQRIVSAIRESGLVDGGYVAETYPDPDSKDAIGVRVLTETLRETEEEALETINNALEKYEN